MLEHKSVCGLNYLYRAPSCDEAKAPAILMLHGAGCRGSDLALLEKNQFFDATSLYAESAPAHLFAPQCHKNTWFDLFESLEAFVEKIASRPDVDEDRLYLMGPSMGGYACWQLAMSMPDRFAAMVPICGGGMYWNAPRLKNLPIWAVHGAIDPTVDVRESERMVEAVNAAGGNAKLTVLPDIRHDSWVLAYSSEEIKQWMFSQKRVSGEEGKGIVTADPKKFG